MAKVLYSMETEHDIQVAVMEWWSLQHKQFNVPEEVLFAIPNGGARNVITGKRLKQEGVRKGVPDMFLAVPMYIINRQYSGLWIELKKPKGRLSKEQATYLELLSKQGYCASVCYGFAKTVEAISRYLEGKMFIFEIGR